VNYLIQGLLDLYLSLTTGIADRHQIRVVKHSTHSKRPVVKGKTEQNNFSCSEKSVALITLEKQFAKCPKQSLSQGGIKGTSISLNS